MSRRGKRLAGRDPAVAQPLPSLKDADEFSRGRRPHVKRPGLWTNRVFSEEAVQVLVAGGGWGRWEMRQAGGTEDGLSRRGCVLWGIRGHWGA